MSWTRIKLSDIQPDKGPSGPHSWKNNNIIARQVCKKCGLVWLRNKLSRWAAKHRKGCDYDKDPSYKATVRRLSRAAA